MTDAVILMAGTGSRLQGSITVLAKPLIPIAGRPLIAFTIDALAKAGVQTLHAVVGQNGDELAAAIAPLLPRQMRFRSILNPHWLKQNGISALTVEGHVRAPFFLTMGDHLFEPSILNRLAAQADLSRLNLAVDRKIDSIFDLSDAMKVQTNGDAVTAIGKDLDHYNAIDTGVFLCPVILFDYLHRAVKEGDCSLADGVRLMAADGRVRAVDIGDSWWQDVDTPAMLSQAEQQSARLFSHETLTGNARPGQG